MTISSQHRQKNEKVNGTSAAFERIPAFFGDKSIQQCLITVATALVVAWLLSPLLPSHHPQYDLDMIASKDIKADRDFLVKDSAATEQKIAEVSKEAPSLFEFDEYLPKLIVDGVKEAFMTARNAGHAEAVEEKHVKKTALAAFESKAGLVLSDDEFDLLYNHGFPSEVETTVLQLITRLYDRYYILDERSSQVQPPHGILPHFYESPSKKELSTVDSKEALTLEEAKEIILSAAGDIEFISEPLRDLAIKISLRLIRPNLVFSPSLTEQNRRKLMEEVKPVFYRVSKGEMIVREGQKITPPELEKLQALSEHRDNRILGGISLFTGTFLLVLILLFILYHTTIHRIGTLTEKTKNILFLASAALLQVILLKAGLFISEAAPLPAQAIDNPYFYAIPFAAGSMLVSVLLGNRDTGLIFSVFTSFTAALLFQEKSAAFFVYSFCGSSIASFYIVRCKKRSDFLRTGLLVGIVNISVVIALALVDGTLFTLNSAMAVPMAVSGGLITGIMVSGTAPLFEYIFGYTTDIKLLELANLNQPIFQKMILTAPGTYHHSIIVASMVEAAAEEIGANSLLAKVGAYYHDIGKMTKPHYYVENQKSWENRHDKLKPSMSSRVIISHVKDGYEMACGLKLGEEIRNIIKQHHGTRLATFFYEKAKKEQDRSQPPILDTDFRYPGPKPQSKEAALVLLADIVEASSRILKNPTPSRIKTLIDTRIREVVDDDQLDASNLTFSDLNKIAECFSRILNGIFHHRIEYDESQGVEPGQEEKHKRINDDLHRKPTEKNTPEFDEDRAVASTNTGASRMR